MRSLSLVFTLSAAGCVLAQANITSTNTTIVPKRYIIELATGSSLADLTAEIQSFPATTIVTTFDSNIFTGVSVESEDGNIDRLTAMVPAAKVWSSKKLQVNAMADVNLAQSFADAAATGNYTLHGPTGVQALQARGILGKGAQIASIDTGIQYTHPALGGCFGAGCTVAGGYDLVGDGCWPDVGCNKVPDSDPNDVLGYGTAMAGVMVGWYPDTNFSGVAPQASLYSYKVMSNAGETDEDTMIEAFLMAYDDGADVITTLFAGTGGFIDGALATILDRLVGENVVVVIPMGDSGEEGPYYAGDGASGSRVIAVGETNAGESPAPVFNVTFHINGSSAMAHIGFETLNQPIADIADGPIVPLTMSTTVTNDACEPLTTAVPNRTEAVILVRLGGCDAQTKQANLIAVNANNILFYDNPDDETWSSVVRRTASAVMMIPAAAGVGIVEAYLAGGSVTANFTGLDYGDIVVGFAGDPYQGSSLTSWGPLYDLSIKPEISAPGLGVYTTLPTDSWITLTTQTSGLFSFASAGYIAGVAALYISAFGGRKTNANFNATELAMRIMTSGHPTKYFDENEFVYDTSSVAQVGTGLVNASKVLDYSTSLSYAKFELNDTHHFERYHSVDITNSASVAVTYTFGLIPAVGFETWDPSAATVVDYDGLTPVSIVPTVSFPSGTFKVAAGAVKTAKIGFTAPDYSSNMPLYSGYVQINSTLGESFLIPYLGLGTNLNTAMTDVFAPSYPSIVSGLESKSIADDSTFSFNLALSVQDFPKLSLRVLWGTDQLRWDIFESTWTERNWVYPPVVGKNGYVGSATYWIYSSDAIDYNPAMTSIASNVTSFPLTGVYRTSVDDTNQSFWWLGSLADGTQIPAGNYIMRVAALIPFGDPSASNGWDTWTQKFTVS